MAELRARAARLRPAALPPRAVLPTLSLPHLCFLSCKMGMLLSAEQEVLANVPALGICFRKGGPSGGTVARLSLPSFPTAHLPWGRLEHLPACPGAGTVPVVAGRVGIRTAVDLTRAPQFPARDSSSEKGWQEGGSPRSYPGLRGLRKTQVLNIKPRRLSHSCYVSTLTAYCTSPQKFPEALLPGPWSQARDTCCERLNIPPTAPRKACLRACLGRGRGTKGF